MFRIRIQAGQNCPQKRFKNWRIFMFEELVLCWTGGFSRSLNVLRRGVRRHIWRLKKDKFLVIKQPWSRLIRIGPGFSIQQQPGYESGFSKMPGSGSGFSGSGSETLNPSLHLDQCAYELMEVGGVGDVVDGVTMRMCDSAASFLYEHWKQQYADLGGRRGR